MSTPSSHCYETVYILRSGTSESDAATIHQKVDNVIEKFQGKLQLRDDWGLKEMAYEIDDENTGRYVVAVYNGTTGVVEEVERHFKISENVIRFMTVAVPKDYDYAKVKRQLHNSEEEVKKNRELRKKMQ
jgi:small subunit ribosomal protein S6